MSQPSLEELNAEFRDFVFSECRAFYKEQYGTFPSDDELEMWFEKYAESDYRQGEE